MWNTESGVLVEFGEGESFTDGVLRVARENELGKFRVFINEEEIEPEDAPEFVGEGEEVRLFKYDVAG